MMASISNALSWLMSDPDGQAVMTLACCFLIGLTMGGLGS